MADSDSDHMIPIRVTDVAGLRDMATKHALRHTHYDGCDRAHIECAALAAADEIERLRALGDALASAALTARCQHYGNDVRLGEARRAWWDGRHGQREGTE